MWSSRQSRGSRKKNSRRSFSRSLCKPTAAQQESWEGRGGERSGECNSAREHPIHLELDRKTVLRGGGGGAADLFLTKPQKSVQISMQNEFSIRVQESSEYSVCKLPC